MSMIPEGRLVIGDEGCKSEKTTHVVSTRNTFDSPDLKLFKKRVKARHESYNCRIKTFNVLDQPFRCTTDDRILKHKAVFEACCVLVQYEMENDRPLFQV